MLAERLQSPVDLTDLSGRRPATPEVAGSSPVAPAPVCRPCYSDAGNRGRVRRGRGSRREAEILTLVTRGLTNREIAAKLVISASTASVHVSHILRKLDARNRREAAAIMHRLSPPHLEPPRFET
jgi:DNA-binding CsgD family transcriptional regulator